MPSHSHTWYSPLAGGAGNANAYAMTYQTIRSNLNPTNKWNDNTGEIRGGNEPTGNNEEHPNLQPYQTIYMYCRIA